MCIIIDANVAGKFCSNPISKEANLIYQKLTKGELHLALGGKLTKELSKTGMRRILIELNRRGATKIYPTNEINAETKKLQNLNICASNDHHVIALARISRARVLFSLDHNLHKDFRDRNFINRPRGSVYSSTNHANLLTNPPNCA
tara:strand:+ start:197 stop:634 length:438 start_codon:yes stop_codon:yes gene_type:complete